MFSKAGENPVRRKGCGDLLSSQGTREYLREFSDVTSLHGVRFVGETGRHPFERLCWVAAILVCAVLCGLEISKIWGRWQDSPIILSFSQRPTSVASVPFPAVLVCPENRVRRSVVDMEHNFSRMRTQLSGEEPFDTPEQQLFAESVSMHCVKQQDYTFVLPSQFRPNKTHREILERTISPRLEDIFVSCRFELKDKECRTLFRPIVTEFGICFAFNMQEDSELFAEKREIIEVDGHLRAPFVRWSTWDPEGGYHFPRSQDEFPYRTGTWVNPTRGLAVVLRSPPEDLQRTCSGGNPDTFRVVVQPPMEFPDAYYRNYFHASPGAETVVTLTPSTVTTAPELRGQRYTPAIRGCNFPEDRKLKLFRTYTKTNCEFECEADIFKRHCGCLKYYLPLEKGGNLTHCPIEADLLSGCGDALTEEYYRLFYDEVEEMLRTTGEGIACGCLPSCSEIKYNFHVRDNVYRHVTENGSDSDNYVKISIFFEEPTFLGKHRIELYGVTDFIASCGGVLGLFTGFSVITAFEVCYFASLRLACRIRSRKVHQQSADVNIGT